MKFSPDNLIQSINDKEIIQFLQKLIRIPSESENEKEIAKFIENYMKNAGLRVKTISNNVIGELGTGDPKLVLNAHMDTVPPGDRSKWTTDPYGAEIQDDRLYGRGSSDNKGGLAAIIMASVMIKKLDIEIPGTISVIGSACEEIGRKKVQERIGMVELLDKNALEGATAAIIAEPTNLQLSLGHRSPNNFEITVRGRSAHAAMPELGINAIEKAAQIITALHNQDLPNHEILGKGTQSVDIIQGGTRPNVVPEGCTLTMDRRLTFGESPESATRDIEDVISKLQKTDPDLQANVRCTYGSLPIYTDIETPIVKIMQKAYYKALKREPVLTCSRFGTDGGFIYHSLNIPVVIFGPGTETIAHQTDEYIEVSQLIEATKVLTASLLAFFNLNKYYKS